MFLGQAELECKFLLVLALLPQTGSVQLLCILLFSIPGATTDDLSQAKIWDRAGLQIQCLHVCGMFILKHR